MSAQRRIRRSDLPVLEFDADGALSLYRSGSEDAVVLNSTASEIWRLTEQEQTLETIVQAVADAHDVEPDAIRVDVEATVDSLRAAGLLQSAPNG
jgi:hypothetical protein